MTIRFQKFGKTYQLRIENERDLEHVLRLDEALWVATSAPIKAFRCDARLLQMINTDGSGRINSNEIRGAIRWLLDMLQDDAYSDAPDFPLQLSGIRADSPDGQRMLAAAHEVCEASGSGDAVTLPDVREFLLRLREKPLNGDGIVVPESANDERRRLIEDVLACVGGPEDASGKPGIDEHQLDAFIEAVRGFQEWREAGQGAMAESLTPFGEDAPRIYEAYIAIASEVDAFFHACRMLRFDAESMGRLRSVDNDVINAMDSDAMDGWLRTRPLATINAEGRLPLARDEVNPFYADKIEALRNEVLPKVLNISSDDLGESSWQALGAALKPYEEYIRSKRGANVEALPPERLAAYRDGSLAERVRDLIQEDRHLAEVRVGAEMLERLLLYRGYLLRLVNNFVSFRDLYDVSGRALFEMGSAVIDGRWFNLAFLVEDVVEHQKMAKESNIFTLYLDVEGAGAQPRFTVAVPAMSGSKGNLQVGKRGVFFDRDGVEHSARISQIIVNPISVREALCAPFVRLWAFLLGKIEAMSSNSEKALQSQTEGLLATPAAGGAPVGSAAAKGNHNSAGMLMGLSVSVAAIGSASAFIIKTLTSLSRGQVFLGLLGAVLVVMVPVSLIAILKLRRQDLSALLEGCGWAINARMRPTRAQRYQFTKAARFPAGAVGVPTRRRLYALLAAAGILSLICLWRRIGM